MYGLDLFSGIGGISIALEPWVKTVAYCEQDRYAQSVLISRMAEGMLCKAPIWDDVQTLTGDMLPPIDIIFGGFPCQDISVAGNGAGLEGKRSGLFFEIIRLTKETGAPFVFLENVPAIRTRGLREVIRAFAEIGYDCRWTCLSAASVGAPHKRERWFLLAHSRHIECDVDKSNRDHKVSTRSIRSSNASDGRDSFASSGIRFNESSTKCDETVAHSSSKRCGEAGEFRREQPAQRIAGGGEEMAHAGGEGLQGFGLSSGSESEHPEFSVPSWWDVEPNVGRVANGIPLRSYRIKCLGNSVVPIQVRTAFEKLSGIAG